MGAGFSGWCSARIGCCSSGDVWLVYCIGGLCKALALEGAGRISQGAQRHIHDLGQGSRCCRHRGFVLMLRPWSGRRCLSRLVCQRITTVCHSVRNNVGPGMCSVLLHMEAISARPNPVSGGVLLAPADRGSSAPRFAATRATQVAWMETLAGGKRGRSGTAWRC